MHRLPQEIYPVAAVREIDSSDSTLLKQLVADHQPFVARGLVASWPLVQQVARTPAGPDRIDLFEPLLGSGEVRFTYLPADQKGDIGMGPDLKPNFSMDSRTGSTGEFLSLVAELVRQPTGECAYAAALPLTALPNAASRLTSLGAIGGEKQRKEKM